MNEWSSTLKPWIINSIVCEKQWGLFAESERDYLLKKLQIVCKTIACKEKEQDCLPKILPCGSVKKLTRSKTMNKIVWKPKIPYIVCKKLDKDYEKEWLFIQTKFNSLKVSFEQNILRWYRPKFLVKVWW